jgi:hypothetical protein
MLKRKIFLNSSEIAAFIGQNTYDFITPFERIWKKYDTQTLTMITNSIKKDILDQTVTLQKLEEEKCMLDEVKDTLTKRQYTLKLNKILDKEKNINNIIYEKNSLIQNQTEFIEDKLGKKALDMIQQDKIETQDKRDLLSNMIKDLKLSPTKKKELEKQTENVINKTHGTLKENNAITLFEKKQKVKLDTSQLYHSLKIKETEHFIWYIGGKMDGIYKDPENPQKSYVVEIKNRTKSFFSTLRPYEKTQIQIYIMLTDVPKAKLVECLKDKLRITDIYKDQEYINEIHECLDIFTLKMDEFLSSYTIEKKNEYMNSTKDQKQVFLKKLYLSDIAHVHDKYILKKHEECLIDDLD